MNNRIKVVAVIAAAWALFSIIGICVDYSEVSEYHTVSPLLDILGSFFLTFLFTAIGVFTSVFIFGFEVIERWLGWED